MRDGLERRCGDPHAGRADGSRAGACPPRRADLAPLPAGWSAGSLMVSRKAKKSGPGSSRRRGPHPHRPPAARRVSIQRHLPAALGGCGRGRSLFPGRCVRGSSSFLGSQQWRAKEGLQNSAFCSRCCQGGGRAEGTLRPRRGQRGRWAVDERQEMGPQVTRAARTGTRGPGREGEGCGDAGQDAAETPRDTGGSSPGDPSSRPPSAGSLWCGVEPAGRPWEAQTLSSTTRVAASPDSGMIESHRLRGRVCHRPQRPTRMCALPYGWGRGSFLPPPGPFRPPICAPHPAPRLRTHKHAHTPSSGDSSINSGVRPTPGP